MELALIIGWVKIKTFEDVPEITIHDPRRTFPALKIVAICRVFLSDKQSLSS